MITITYRDGTPQPGRFIAHAAPDNDNWGVAGNGQTPAEALQMIRRWKAQARRELAEDFSLRSDPEHRKTWEITLAMEKCALWIYWKVRKD